MFLCLRSILLLAWCVSTCVQAQQAVRTARLVAYKADKRYSGSAFFIDREGTAVTCYHVIQGAHLIDAFVHEGIRKVTVLSIDPVHDLATLRIDEVASINPFPPHREHLQHLAALSPVVYPGFLNGSEDNLPLKLSLTRDRLMKSGDFVDNDGKQPFFAQDVDLIEFVGLGQHGMSGSAVVNTQTGEAIGVLEGSLTQGAGLSWAIPLEYLKARQTRTFSQPAAAAQIVWPPLELIKGATVSALDSIPLVTSFEPHLDQTEKDRETYRDLLAAMDQTFDACYRADKAWNHHVQSLPDGLPWPLRSGDLPNVTVFNQEYEAAANAARETCGKANDLLQKIETSREKIKVDMSQLTQDLDASKPVSLKTRISAGLAKDLEDTARAISAKQQEADSLAKDVNAAIEEANKVHPSPVTDTGGLKKYIFFLGASDIPALSPESRRSLRLSYDATTDFLTLISDNVSFLAAIPKE